MLSHLLPQGLNVYLINLDRATERLRRMEAKLTEAGLPFERVPAVDGAALAFPHPDFDARAYRHLHGRRIIPAEVGCYLSHVACARRLLESEASHALILEDDVSFAPDFLPVLKGALQEGASWDILRLSTVNKGPKFGYRSLAGGRRLAKALTREKGAGAYVINRAAAAWITGKLMPMRLSWDIAFDLEYLDGLRAAFVDPPPAQQRDEEVSQIQNGIKAAKYPATRYLTVLPYRAWLELTRLAFRGGHQGYLRLHFMPHGHWLKAAALAGALMLGIDEIFETF